MAGYRRRLLIALPIAAAFVWSCTFLREAVQPLNPPPPSFNQTAFRDSILRVAPPLSEFDRASGDSTHLGHANLVGEIRPHVNARRDAL